MIAHDSASSRGILLIGHGSRDQQGTKQFFQLADRLAESVSPMVVEPALLEFQEPTIQQAWHSLVAHGVQHIHVAPLLLFAAGHAKQDIPDVIEKCRQQTPKVTWNQSHPLSRHSSVVDLVVQQVRTAIENRQSLDRTALIMVGRGNRDPCAQADMRVLSELVDHRVESVSTYTAFYAMAEPKLTDVLESVGASDAYDSIIVHPHLLFEGRLHQAITEQVNLAANKFQTIPITMSRYLGPTRQVAQAIADRVMVAESLLTRDVDY